MAQTALTPKASLTAFDWKKWIGVAPFFLFALLFLVLPSLRLFIGSFTDIDGQFTFANVIQLFQEQAILDAYWLSIRISADCSWRRHLWFFTCICCNSWRTAEAASFSLDHIFRCSLQFCRRSAGLRFYCNTRTHRICDRAR